jgi:hypothetical protein
MPASFNDISDAFELVSMGGFDEHQAFRAMPGMLRLCQRGLRHA